MKQLLSWTDVISSFCEVLDLLGECVYCIDEYTSCSELQFLFSARTHILLTAILQVNLG